MAKGTCSSCGKTVVVNAKSRPEPVCHECRRAVAGRRCYDCGKAIGRFGARCYRCDRANRAAAAGVSEWETGVLCIVYFPTCGMCGRMFCASRYGQHMCSRECRIRGIQKRQLGMRATVEGLGLNGKDWYEEMVTWLRARDGDGCGICGGVIDFTIPSGPRSGNTSGRSIDHITPVFQGGGDETTNLRLTHWGCNQTRHMGTWDLSPFHT